MTNIPFWKLKREAKRAGRQILGLPKIAWEYLFLRPYYDYKTSRQMICHSGSLPIGKELAIYLVYAPDGLKESHYDALDLMIADNVTPVIVSNVPLLSSDRTKVLEKSALVIERPNVGYDFGGYRDAILQLSKYFSQLERLYILNDSSWMMSAEKSWFQRVRESGCDFAGATSNYGIHRYDADKFRDLVWKHTPEHPNFHYASYALAVGANILNAPGFLKYWKFFRISDSKKRTIRRGEIGLTQWVMSNGYSHCATCDVTHLDREIEALDDENLDEVARHLVIPEDMKLIEHLKDVLKSDPNTEEGRRDRVQIILSAVARQAMGYSMPFYAMKYRGFQFVKKSPLRLSRHGAEAMLSIMSGRADPVGRRAFVEAQKMFEECEESSRPPEGGH